LTELSYKLKIILEQDDVKLLQKRRQQIFVCMTIACASSLSIIIVADLNLDRAFQLNQTSLAQFESEVVHGESTFGIMSGTYFLLIAFALLLMFNELFRLINSGHKLSESLQHQKGGLKMMICLVIVSYVISALVFFLYGRWRNWISLFDRWLIYPVLAIIIELPNMLVIYIIHW